MWPVAADVASSMCRCVCVSLSQTWALHKLMVAGISPKEVAVLGHLPAHCNNREHPACGRYPQLYSLCGSSDIDRYLPPALGLRQSSCASLLLSIDGTDRQTDRRTDTVLYYRCSRLEPGGVSNYQLLIRTVRTVCGADSLWNGMVSVRLFVRLSVPAVA